MELQDIKSKKELGQQVEIYGAVAEQLADNLQDLKRLKIDGAKSKDIESAKSMIYHAAEVLAMAAEELQDDNEY